MCTSFRSLVTDIMAALRTLYSFKKVRKETEDEFINSYLKNVVVPLWPSGWMRVDELRKESDRYVVLFMLSNRYLSNI